MAVPTPRCPLRPGEPCSLCQLNVTGPADCGLVYLVMDDPELRDLLSTYRTGAGGRPEAAKRPSQVLLTVCGTWYLDVKIFSFRRGPAPMGP